MKSIALHSLAMGAALACGILPAVADSILLHPVADTTLAEVAPNNNFGGTDFFIAGTSGTGNRNRALLRFDLAPLPAGVTIQSVTLTLDVVHQPLVDPAGSSFSLHQALKPWTEGNKTPLDAGSPGLGAPATLGESTWRYRSAFDTLWAAPGGQAGVDYITTPSASAFVFSAGDPAIFDSTSQMVSDVQGWVRQPNANLGWFLLSDSEEIQRTARRFASREDSAGGPGLLVEYMAVPEPATGWILLLGSAASVVLLGFSPGRREP